MTDGQIDFTIAKIKEYGLVDSGAAAEGGIGCLSLTQVKSFFDKMVEAKVVKADIDYTKVVTDRFACKKVGIELKKAFFPSDSNYRHATALEICRYCHVGAGDLCIVVSISGSTRRTVEAAEAARRAGARTLAVTCDAESALGRSCDEILHLPFTPISRLTPHTIDYTMTVVALAVIGEHLAGRRYPWIDDLPGTMGKTIDRAIRDSSLSFDSDGSEDSRWFFLGGGPGAGVASYGAAKFHEAGGLPAWSGELENFMHGMHFILEPNDRVCLVVHDLASWERASRIADSLRGIGVRPCFVLPSGAIQIDGGSQPPIDKTALVTCAIPLQLICLEHANRLGLSLEAPRAGRRNGERYLRAQRSYFEA